MKIAVVTDSTSDLDPQYVLQSGVHIVPSHIIFDTSEHLDDGKTLKVSQILHDMAHGKGRVTTSPPTAAQYQATYRALLEEAEHIISLHTSPQIAQNINVAQAAAQDFGRLVTVLDSRSTTAAQGMQVQRLIESIAQGKELSQLVKEQQYIAQRCQVLFMVDDLQFLRLNNRISAVAAFVGNALNIKPILGIQNAYIEPVNRAMGQRRALSTIASSVRAYQRQYQNIRVGFPHSLGGENAIYELRNMLADIPFEDAGNWKLGASVAANTGPGAVGVALEPNY